MILYRRYNIRAVWGISGVEHVFLAFNCCHNGVSLTQLLLRNHTNIYFD